LQASTRNARRLPVDVALVRRVFAVVTAEILVTYSRGPAHELYYVSGSGIPDVLEPRLTVAWSLIVIAMVLLWALWVRLVDWSGDEESPLCPEPDGLPARR
jgi:hypothetical protein